MTRIPFFGLDHDIDLTAAGPPLVSADIEQASMTLNGFFDDRDATVETVAPLRVVLPHLAGEYRAESVRIVTDYYTGEMTVQLSPKDRARLARYLQGPTRSQMRSLHSAYRMKRRHW